MKEKRKYVRSEKKIKSEVHSENGMTYSTSADLSHGGIFISTPEPVTIGSIVQLSIVSPDGYDIEVKGIVRWMDEGNIKKDRNGMGIEFVEMSEDMKNKLKSILE